MGIPPTGQTGKQSVQAVHFSGSTYLGFLTTLTLKSPAFPAMLFTLAKAMIVILGLLVSSSMRGSIVHVAHSFEGNSLSICAILPPIVGLSSTRITLNP